MPKEDALKLVKSALLIAIMGALVVSMLTYEPPSYDESVEWDRDAPSQVAPSAPVNSPAALLEAHEGECWSGSAKPLAEYPGHVIWQHPDGRTVYSRRLVGPALDALFAGGDLAGSPIAFCL